MAKYVHIEISVSQLMWIKQIRHNIGKRLSYRYDFDVLVYRASSENSGKVTPSIVDALGETIQLVIRKIKMYRKL
jgi:hypothetical protein